MIQWPTLLGGTHKIVPWLNRLRNSCRAAEIKQVVGGYLKPSTDGQCLVILGNNSSSITNPFTISQSTDWLTYKVSTGLVVLSGDPITPTQVDVDLTITAGVEHYWFYIDIGTTTAEVKTSATTLAWGCNKIPLGWVDTLTNQATTTAKIYQLQRDHIFSPGA
jgi:hypothetical protein